MQRVKIVNFDFLDTTDRGACLSSKWSTSDVLTSDSSIVRACIPIRWGIDCITTWSSPNPNPNPNTNTKTLLCLPIYLQYDCRVNITL
jgi:hypothetical protein